jgi:RNA 3'-terminal phosphate cyclase (ATP)
MITIDGSQGEGGGQIIRTSLALSLVTGQPFRINNIRARRRKPGLLRQHLTGVEAATQIGLAETDGAVLGSTSVTFRPKKIVPGNYAFSVGTAGSATLVLQTVLPALMLANGPSTLVLEGGTHNSMAPPFDFIEKTFLPILNRMGPRVHAILERPGFYPAGGGRMQVTIEPVKELRSVDLVERGTTKSRRGRVVIANLSYEIGKRQERMLRNKLGWAKEEVQIERANHSAGPGNVVMAEVETESHTEVFSSFGGRDIPSKRVVDGVVSQVREYWVATAPVGEHLADQLMIPIALARGGGYRAIKHSLHARTNREVIEQFLGTVFEIRNEAEGTRVQHVRD